MNQTNIILGVLTAITAMNLIINTIWFLNC